MSENENQNGSIKSVDTAIVNLTVGTYEGKHKVAYSKGNG